MNQNPPLTPPRRGNDPPPGRSLDRSPPAEGPGVGSARSFLSTVWNCRLNVLLGLLLIITTFLVYQPAWRGEPVYDDDDHLTPPELRSWSGLARIWFHLGVVSQYYPVTHSLFWVEHRLWGDAMLGYHLANIFLHVCCALLLVRILKRLEIPGAWLAAAIFALHPVCVESVAWISEQKTRSRRFLFGLRSGVPSIRPDAAAESYVLAFALFLLGLLSKTVVATLPAALLLIFWWKRGTLSWKRHVVPLAPFFAVGIGAGIFTAWVERKFIGAEGEAFNLSFLQRSLIAGGRSGSISANSFGRSI